MVNLIDDLLIATAVAASNSNIQCLFTPAAGARRPKHDQFIKYNKHKHFRE